MQIVIDIPADDYYDALQYVELKVNTEFENLMIGAIKNGTPLPKGHGRLIDADKIVAEATKGMKYPANHKYMECVIAHMKLAPTIIEANKEENGKMLICPECGLDVHSDYKKCPRCGAKMEGEQ